MESLPRHLELTVIRSWLKGKSRDEIALEFGKSQGTISNIISTLRNSMTRYDFDSMRELAKELRRAELTVDNCAVGFRTHNIITKLKIPENEIERFLTSAFEFAKKLGVDQNMMREILIESANMSIQVPISEIPTYFHKQREEIQQLHKKKKELEEEIQSLNKQKLAIEEKLNNSCKISNVTEETLQDFIHVKKELEFHGISMRDQAKFVKCVVGIKKLCDYNPFEVVEKFV